MLQLPISLKLGQNAPRHPVNFLTLSLSPTPGGGYDDHVFLCAEPRDPQAFPDYGLSCVLSLMHWLAWLRTFP